MPWDHRIRCLERSVCHEERAYIGRRTCCCSPPSLRISYLLLHVYYSPDIMTCQWCMNCHQGIPGTMAMKKTNRIIRLLSWSLSTDLTICSSGLIPLRLVSLQVEAERRRLAKSILVLWCVVCLQLGFHPWCLFKDPFHKEIHHFSLYRHLLLHLPGIISNRLYWRYDLHPSAHQ